MQYLTEYELTTSRQLAEPFLNRDLERRRVAAERREEAGGRPASPGVFARLVAWVTGNRRGISARAEQATAAPRTQVSGAH